MNKETRDALEGSISKWTRLANGETYEENGHEDCALCSLFHNYSEGVCSNECPVKAKTGMNNCGDTPYGNAKRALKDVTNVHCMCLRHRGERDEARAKCQKMLDFLIALRPAKVLTCLEWHRQNVPTQELIDKLSGKTGVYKLGRLLVNEIPKGTTYLTVNDTSVASSRGAYEYIGIWTTGLYPKLDKDSARWELVYRNVYSREAVSANKPTQEQVDAWTKTKGAWIVDRVDYMVGKDEMYVCRNSLTGENYGADVLLGSNRWLTGNNDLDPEHRSYRWILVRAKPKVEPFEIGDEVWNKSDNSVRYLVTVITPDRYMIGSVFYDRAEAHEMFELVD